MAALGHKLQEVGFISKYQTVIQPNAKFVIIRGQFSLAGAAVGMRIAKMPLRVLDRQSDGAALALSFLSKSGRDRAIEFNGFQSNQSGLNGPSNLVVKPFLR